MPQKTTLHEQQSQQIVCLLSEATVSKAVVEIKQSPSKNKTGFEMRKKAVIVIKKNNICKYFIMLIFLRTNFCDVLKNFDIFSAPLP